MKPESTIKTAIDRIGYSDEWVKLGALTEETASHQLEALSSPNSDSNLEHYRWETISRYLSEQDQLSNCDFRLLLAIAQAELSKELHESIYHALAKRPSLTESQSDQLASAYSSDSFDKVLFREDCKRRLTTLASEDAIIEAINSDDAVLQRWLIENIEISFQHAMMLSRCGKSKAVRSLATAIAGETEKGVWRVLILRTSSMIKKLKYSAKPRQSGPLPHQQ